MLLHKGFKTDRRPRSVSAWWPKPPDLPCREDVLVEGDATSPGSCLPSLKMRSPTPAGGLLPTGEASTATKTTSNEPLLGFYPTEEMNPEEDSKKENLWTSIASGCYGSSFWKLLAAPYCRRVVHTKSRQNRTFDPGGSQGHLRACPFLGSWRVLVCGEVYGLRQLVTSCSVLSREIRWLSETRPALMRCKKKPSCLERLKVISQRHVGHVVEGDSR